MRCHCHQAVIVIMLKNDWWKSPKKFHSCSSNISSYSWNPRQMGVASLITCVYVLVNISSKNIQLHKTSTVVETSEHCDVGPHRTHTSSFFLFSSFFLILFHIFFNMTLVIGMQKLVTICSTHCNTSKDMWFMNKLRAQPPTFPEDLNFASLNLIKRLYR